jgi:hypothetical protein
MNAEPKGWLLLVHQLPAKPAYLRVKTWRRLQALGAVALKGSVYVLPATEGTLEDLQWLSKEIASDGGEAVLCEARLIEGLTDAEARALFNGPRAADYRALADEVRAFGQAIPQDALGQAGEVEALKAQLARLRKRLVQIAAVDFFGADGRVAAEAALLTLESRLAAPLAGEAAPAELGGLKGRAWVTRQGVHVDRIACAWLIRRFIDPEARFKFVEAKGYVPGPGELRFDMFDGEFTHEGDNCSFETILARIGSRDPALKAIGEIVHDIDLKDGKFQRDETAGVDHLLAGLAAPRRSDPERIDKGAVILDALYDYFRGGA